MDKHQTALSNLILWYQVCAQIPKLWTKGMDNVNAYV